MFAKRFFVTVFLLVMALALVACGAPSVEPGAAPEDATGTPVAEEVAAEALAAARAALADFLGVDEAALELESIEDAEWSDGCLGLGQADEGCIAVITPGYAITFNVDGESYTVRTDLEGNAVRVEAAYEGQEPGGTESDAPEAAMAALEQLAAELGLAAEEIEIVSWSAEEWTDSCLGLGGPAESCLQVITPGYLVTLQAGEQVINVRTDESGAVVRIEQPATGGDERPGVVEVALQTLAAELGAPMEALEVVSFEQTEWSDSCLGLGGPAESCLQAITPGWRVMISFDGATYEVRTDETGEAVRIAWEEAGSITPDPELGDAVLFYERSGGIAGEIMTVRVYADGTVERTVGVEAPSDAVEVFEADAAAVEELLAGLEAVGYFELERSYMPEDPCCDRYMYLMSARPAEGVEAHTVEALETDEDTPQAVWDSVALIETFVQEVVGEES